MCVYVCFCISQTCGYDHAIGTLFMYSDIPIRSAVIDDRHFRSMHFSWSSCQNTFASHAIAAAATRGPASIWRDWARNRKRNRVHVCSHFRRTSGWRIQSGKPSVNTRTHTPALIEAHTHRCTCWWRFFTLAHRIVCTTRTCVCVCAERARVQSKTRFSRFSSRRNETKMKWRWRGMAASATDWN